MKLAKDGHMEDKPVSFNDFLSAHPNLFQNLYQGVVTNDDIAVLMQNLKTAIESGIYYYMYDKQTELSTKMDLQRKQYAAHLQQWFDRSEHQLSLDFEDAPTTIQQKNKEKKYIEIKTIASKENAFYQNITTLDNTDPYIKVLAVFYNF